MTPFVSRVPRPHQDAAISACVAGLKKSGSRGQCIMACGTGKTMVGYEVAKQLKAQSVLVIVPSLHYRRGAMPWDYESSELAVLCDDCHEAITESTRSLKAIVERGDVATLYRLSAYAQAITAKIDPNTPPIRVYSMDHVRGIADAFAEAGVYEFIVGTSEVIDRCKDRDFNAVAMANEEQAAMDVALKKWARNE